MVISKDLISSPLEAGPSLVDSQKLPPQVMEALGYVSGKLMRKHLHLTFVVIRDPPQPHPVSGPASSHPSPNPSLPRSSSISSFSRRYLTSLSGSLKFPTGASSLSLDSPSSPLTMKITTPQLTNSYNISLLQAQKLSPRVARYISQIVTKASKKYSVGDVWLPLPSPTSPRVLPTTPMTPLTPPTPVSPLTPITPTSPLSPVSPVSPTMGPSSDLVRRSLLQNDVLFSREGLTLLSLDRVYTFKACLSAYARTLSPSQSPNWPSDSSSKDEEAALTRAVESLRLLILFQNGRCITKSYLLRAYDHISVNIDALKRVNQAYRKAFNVDAIHGVEAGPPKQFLNWRVRRSKLGRSKPALAGLRGSMTSEVERSSVSPNLKLNTGSFQEAGETGVTGQGLDTSEHFDTPTSLEAHAWYIKDEDDDVLIDDIQRLDPRAYLGAPKTPKHLDDVTPITRGEWHWLMGDRPRRVAVETC